LFCQRLVALSICLLVHFVVPELIYRPQGQVLPQGQGQVRLQELPTLVIFYLLTMHQHTLLLDQPLLNLPSQRLIFLQDQGYLHLMP
jgi:hypothetical protein